jgi:DNA invertase Pin-like site-specific DNA recombinase
MTQAVGHIRASTQGQVRDGYSLAYQRGEILRYCADNGIELMHIYEDKGISGAKVDEDGLTVEREGLHSPCLPTLQLSRPCWGGSCRY